MLAKKSKKTNKINSIELLIVYNITLVAIGFAVIGLSTVFGIDISISTICMGVLMLYWNYTHWNQISPK